MAEFIDIITLCGHDERVFRSRPVKTVVLMHNKTYVITGLECCVEEKISQLKKEE